MTLDVWYSLEEVLEKWTTEGKSPELLDLVDQIYQYVHSCKELGASINELKVECIDASNHYEIHYFHYHLQCCL